MLFIIFQVFLRLWWTWEQALPRTLVGPVEALVFSLNLEHYTWNLHTSPTSQEIQFSDKKSRKSEKWWLRPSDPRAYTLITWVLKRANGASFTRPWELWEIRSMNICWRSISDRAERTHKPRTCSLRRPTMWPINWSRSHPEDWPTLQSTSMVDWNTKWIISLALAVSYGFHQGIFEAEHL